MAFDSSLLCLPLIQYILDTSAGSEIICSKFWKNIVLKEFRSQNISDKIGYVMTKFILGITWPDKNVHILKSLTRASSQTKGSSKTSLISWHSCHVTQGA